MLFAVPPGGVSATAEPGDAAFAAASAWIQARADEVARSCRMTAADGTIIWVPDGEQHYNAFWVRDFCTMIEGAPDAFDLDEARRGYLWLLARQREDGAMPDRVEPDGAATYIPGPRDRPIAAEPVTDGPPFMVKICHELVQRSGEVALFQETAGALERGMEWVPRNPETGLVHIPLGESRCPYGFTDTVRKKGDLLFSSLLYWEAAAMLERMWVRAGELDRARHWQAVAERVRAGLETLWDESRGYYLAASLRCRQADVWGTAYAVYLGVPEPARQERIARQLASDFPRWAYAGQVRHLLAPEVWEDCLAAPETYQNGGYWSTPTGWLYRALLQADPALARQLITDLAADFQTRAAVPEWVTPSASALRLYGASLAGPAAALRRAALVGHPAPAVPGETSLPESD